jgi:hypothetical protein
VDLSQLKSFNIEGCRYLTNAAMLCVSSSLRRACVSETRILNSPAHVILTIDGMKGLPSRILELRGFGCHLPNWATLSGLSEPQVLHLPYSTLSDAGADAVLPQLSALREVVLRATRVSDKKLLGITTLGYLQVLDVSETLMTARGMAVFLNAKCRLTLTELMIGRRYDWSPAQVSNVRELARISLRPDTKCV